MSSALRRGRTLNPVAVEDAVYWREQRIFLLKSKLEYGTISFKERSELRWKWGVRPSLQESIVQII